MIDDLHLRGLSGRTHEAYLRAVRKLSEYCRALPDDIGEAQTRQYLLYLKNELDFAPGSLRVALNGIKFFYRYTAPRSWTTLVTVRIPQQKTLRDVLSTDEVRRVLAAVNTPHNRAYLWTVYSCGLRLNEGLNLQVSDIDGDRMMIHIHRGKGAKDRYVLLPTGTCTCSAPIGSRTATPDGYSRPWGAVAIKAAAPRNPWLSPACKAR